MQVQTLTIPDVKVLTPAKLGDRRGFFSEVYSARTLAEAGIHCRFVQDNHSFSARRGTVRGLHFQTPPHAQDKLVRVVRGSVFDVAVDLRRSSPTYGRHVSAVLCAEAWNQILVPVGFAHGFMTLDPDTEIIYKVSDYYAPDHDEGTPVERSGARHPVAHPGDGRGAVREGPEAAGLCGLRDALRVGRMAGSG